MIRRIACFCLLVVHAAFVLPTSADAKEVQKGSAFLSIMLSQGDGDLIGPEELTTGSVSAYEHSEWGGQIQYQYLFNEHWAVAPAVGMGTFKETDKPGDNTTPGEGEFSYKQKSWNVRIGLDRFANLGDGFVLFAGPGFSLWNGHANFAQDLTLDAESEDVTRISVDGRIGGHVAVGETLGLTGYLGQYIGHASGEDAGAKASWWPSGMIGGMGVSLHF
jgi:hypothetical protein